MVNENHDENQRDNKNEERTIDASSTFYLDSNSTLLRS
jgi:hypothetical protein